MKKLYKKIGAVALASMIIAGGVGASRIDSHALWGSKSSVVIDQSNWNLNSLSHNAKVDADYLEDYLKHEANDIMIIVASDNKDAMNKYIKENYPDKPYLSREVAPDCFYGRNVVDIFRGAERRGEDIVKVKFSDVFVLLSKR